MGEEATVVSGVGTYVVVEVGAERYCLDVHEVREIVPEAHVTRVPGAPPGVGGVINVRGRVMALIDLDSALDGHAVVEGPATAVVVDADLADDVAVRVARVVDVIELGDAELQPPPAFGLGSAGPYAAAVAELADGLAVVLSLDRLLGDLGRDVEDGVRPEDPTSV